MEETVTGWKWTHREMVRMIDLWFTEQCLWKTLLPEYKVRSFGCYNFLQILSEKLKTCLISLPKTI